MIGNVRTNVILRRVRVTSVAWKKQLVFGTQRMSVAFIIQYKMCIRHLTLLYAAYQSVPYFPTFSHKRYDFRGIKKKLLNTKCVI
jgi:hypothetical protein